MQVTTVVESPGMTRFEAECALQPGAWRPLSEAVHCVLRDIEFKTVAGVEQCLPEAA